MTRFVGRIAAFLVAASATAQAQLILSSPAFEKFSPIPERYGCDAVMRDAYRPSVPLQWTRAPAATRSFVLVMDDIDDEEKVLWLVKDIPSTVSRLVNEASEMQMPKGAQELSNSFGLDSYVGPCPEDEEHQYRFRLFAMPSAHTLISLPEDPTELRATHIIDQIADSALISAVLVGKFALESVKEGDTVVIDGQQQALENEHRKTITYSGKKLVKGKRTDYSNAVAQHRYVKPSEVLRTNKAKEEAAVALPADCEDVKPGEMTIAECVIKKAKAEAQKRAQNVLVQAKAATTLSTARMVEQRVERFRRDIDTWSCESEYKRREGVRVVHGNSTKCPLRVRVTDAECTDDAMWPRQFVCAGAGGASPSARNASMSPSIQWTGVPEGTQSLVVVVEESSPPPFVDDFGKVFWIVSDVPTSSTSIPAGASGSVDMPPLAFELRNSFGKSSYTPPCPGPHEVREYRVRIFAMPHQRTLIKMPRELRAGALVGQLQKEALCMATSELRFSFKKASVTQSRPLDSVEATPVDLAGESPAVEAGNI